MPPNSEAVLTVSESPESPEFSVKTSSLPQNRFRFINLINTRNIIIIFVLLFLSLFIFILLSNLASSGSFQDKVCQTQACIEAGKFLYESINFSVNPCDNFYQYACGGWIANNPIPPDKSSISQDTIIAKKILISIRRLLESSTKTGKSPVSQSVQLAKDLYRECMDQETRDKLGITPLKQKLGQLLGTSWPIMNADQLAGQATSHFNFIETFTMFKHFGVSPIINFGVKPDPKKPNKKLIYFAKPNFGLEAKEFTNQTAHRSKVTEYRKFLRKVATLFAGEEADGQILLARLEEIYEFESKLALAKSPNEEDSSEWYSKMSLDDFKNFTSYQLDWTKLLRLYTRPYNLPYSITSDHKVLVMDSTYYLKMAKLVYDTPLHVLYNYLGFRFVTVYRSYADSKMQEINFEFIKATTGVTEMLPSWEKCLRSVHENLGLATSRLYVDHQVAEDTKERAEEMISDLQAAFRFIVKYEALWLDDVTRARVLEKEATTQYFAAYPQWIQNNAKLDDVYGFSDKTRVSFKQGKYLETLLDFERIRAGTEFRDLYKAKDVTVIGWQQVKPAEINAASGRTENAIVVTAGILEPPCFDPGHPAYMNFGGIGAVIGHEITHQFDDDGRLYDKSGNMINWWSEATKKRFDAEAACFKKQYGSIVDNATGLNLDGTITINENIADNGGVRAAFFAFQFFAKRNKVQLLPRMGKFSVEQLFFLSYGQYYCSNNRPEEWITWIKHYIHLPGLYRTNVPLSNFEQFAKAFNCPKGSPMNPVKKCRLW